MAKESDWVLFEEEKPESRKHITVLKKNGEIRYSLMRISDTEDDNEAYWFGDFIEDEDVLKWRYRTKEDMDALNELVEKHKKEVGIDEYYA